MSEPPAEQVENKKKNELSFLFQRPIFRYPEWWKTRCYKGEIFTTPNQTNLQIGIDKTRLEPL